MNTAALAPKCSFVLTYSCDQHQYKPPLEPSAFRVVHEYNNALKKKKKKAKPIWLSRTSASTAFFKIFNNCTVRSNPTVTNRLTRR